MKVARARTEEGLVVVKVFVRHDPSLPLDTHQARLAHIQKALTGAVNCLQFQKYIVSSLI